MAQHIQQASGSLAAWSAANTLLMKGEVGWELDPAGILAPRFKVGDGVTAWNSLAYIATGGSGGGGGGAVTSVQGRIGDVVLTKADVSLGNVDNTSDASKWTALAVLTNKSMDGGSNTFTNIPASALTGVIGIAHLATGTPNGAKFVRDDGTLATPAGSGTVTASAGNLTANELVLGAGTTDTKVAPGIATDGTSQIQLGVAGSSVGSIKLANATSGSVVIQPPTGALASAVLTTPIGTDTLAGLAATQTFSNKTLALTTLTGAIIAAGVSMTTVIDFTKPENDVTLSSAPTLTVGGSPATGQWTTIRMVGDTVNRVVTLPAGTWRSDTLQATLTSFTMPANQVRYITIVKTAAGYDLFGEPEPIQDRSFGWTQTVGANLTKTLVGFFPQPGSIKALYGKTSSGTIAGQLTINGTNVTGAAATAASSRANGAASGSNVMAVGDIVALVASGNASALNVDWTMIWTPTLL